MAITNHERVGEALESLRAGLAPFAEPEFASGHRGEAQAIAKRYLPPEDRINAGREVARWDAEGAVPETYQRVVRARVAARYSGRRTAPLQFHRGRGACATCVPRGSRIWCAFQCVL